MCGENAAAISSASRPLRAVRTSCPNRVTNWASASSESSASSTTSTRRPKAKSLRGDSSDPSGKYQPHPGGYENAAALIEGLLRIAPFEISTAAYPEMHPDSHDEAADLDNLKRKIDAGATRAITQFFFEPECFFRFRDKAAAHGIAAEIVPGIMPIMSFASVQRMSGLCGTAIPAWLETLFEGLDERPAARQLVAATVAAELCRRLYAGDVRKFHFYTLNRAELSYAICHLLGRRPAGDVA